MSLEGGDLFLAYLFGVAIDLDHLFRLPRYFKKHGFKRVRLFDWRIGFQEPISLLWVIPFSVFISSYIPLVFFLGHLFLDYSLSYPKKPFSSFSNYETHGFFSKTIDLEKDRRLELITVVVLVFLNLALWLIKKGGVS